MRFEIIRRAGDEMRPQRTTGSGVKSRVNAGACLELDGIYFVTTEPEDPARAGRYNAALEVIVAALRAAGHEERNV